MKEKLKDGRTGKTGSNFSFAWDRHGMAGVTVGKEGQGLALPLKLCLCLLSVFLSSYTLCTSAQTFSFPYYSLLLFSGTSCVFLSPLTFPTLASLWESVIYLSSPCTSNPHLIYHDMCRHSLIL